MGTKTYLNELNLTCNNKVANNTALCCYASNDNLDNVQAYVGVDIRLARILQNGKGIGISRHLHWDTASHEVVWHPSPHSSCRKAATADSRSVRPVSPPSSRTQGMCRESVKQRDFCSVFRTAKRLQWTMNKCATNSVAVNDWKSAKYWWAYSCVNHATNRPSQQLTLSVSHHFGSSDSRSANFGTTRQHGVPDSFTHCFTLADLAKRMNFGMWHNFSRGDGSSFECSGAAEPTICDCWQ